jgi:dGTPase
MSWELFLNEGRLKPSTRDKSNDSRNEFESDFGRIIFSPALRRMHDKTQVFSLTTDDNIHSRLTHSLEVMSVGESIATNIIYNEVFISKTKLTPHETNRIIPVIVKNSCLVHDIGNPPFGHFGETVIQNYFQKLFWPDRKAIKEKRKPKYELEELEREDFELFDGNAQGFRVLSKLQILDDIFGLNLTYATLGAYTKYPNPGEISKDILSLKKRGVFQSERGHFEKIAKEVSIVNGSSFYRHPLSFIMEAADSICYLVMDLEDGFNKKWYNYDYIKAQLIDVQGMDDIFKRIDSSSNNEISKIVKLRLALIKRLVGLSVSNFISNFEDISEGRYNFELINDDPNKLAQKLVLFSCDNIFSNKEITSLELTGHSILKGLFDHYIEFCFCDSEKYRKRAIGMISNSIIRASLLETGKSSFEELSDYYKFRVIVDFITGMTDQYALNHYQKLNGQKII